MQRYKNILLATDLTPVCFETAKMAKELAQTHGAKLSLLHVVEAMPGYASGYIGAVDIERSLYDDAKANLAEMGTAIEVPEAEQHIKIGSPKNVIINHADSVGADLIVIGSHGRHGIGKLLGSTAAAILQGANCDVLTIKHHD